MQRMTAILFVLVLIALVAPSARAEEWPLYGNERVVSYYTGTCGVSLSWHGSWLATTCEITHSYSVGTRTGKWRQTTDESCEPPAGVGVKYEVCTDGSNCSDSSGTWVEISQSEFESAYCP
jgi:hypothetical protein